ncbi:uncharacterized protein LOC130049552 [Ostrea edulis]|uniref:uncharacterized protein LOC130049552 n=1 Tax=Ostrea edulis TaxID=37623 RepID=UPI0024AED15B|nr:uncharacterized protein LOC130049552 [Ostrea edulis]
MNGVCNQINGQLYQIEDMLLLSTTKRNILQTYVTNFLKNGHYVIQGRLVICVPPLKCWRNEDGTVAVPLTFFPPPDNVLAIDARTGDVDSNGIDVKSTRGFICEEVDIDD